MDPKEQLPTRQMDFDHCSPPSSDPFRFLSLCSLSLSFVFVGGGDSVGGVWVACGWCVCVCVSESEVGSVGSGVCAHTHTHTPAHTHIHTHTGSHTNTRSRAAGQERERENSFGRESGIEGIGRKWGEERIGHERETGNKPVETISRGSWIIVNPDHGRLDEFVLRQETKARRGKDKKKTVEREEDAEEDHEKRGRREKIPDKFRYGSKAIRTIPRYQMTIKYHHDSATKHR